MLDVSEIEIYQIAKSFQLPARPEILSQIQDEMNKDDPSLVQVSEYIAHDVGLSAFILKLINSPAFGFNRQVVDIKQSVMLLGSDTIKSLVTGYFIKQSYQGDACISLERFWDSATLVAEHMANMSGTLGHQVPMDLLYCFGLFHDCGIPALAQKYENYNQVLEQANTQENDVQLELEEQYFKTNHAIIGYFIASSWRLPDQLCRLILHHHDEHVFDKLTGDDFQQAFAAFKLSENIVNMAYRGKNVPGWLNVQDKVFDVLGIVAEQYDEFLDEMMEKMAG